MYNYTIYYDDYEIPINTPYELKKGDSVYFYIPNITENRSAMITRVQYEFHKNGVIERVEVFTDDL